MPGHGSTLHPACRPCRRILVLLLLQVMLKWVMALEEENWAQVNRMAGHPCHAAAQARARA